MDRAAVSFSGEVKQELARLWPRRSCCQRAELAALMAALGHLKREDAAAAAEATIADGSERGWGLSLFLSSDQASVARKILMLIRSSFGLRRKVTVRRRQRLRKNLIYTVHLPAQPGLVPMLRGLGVLGPRGKLWTLPPEGLLEKDCCRRSYLRGVFLATGWISPPDRAHHLELMVPGTEAADDLGQMLFAYGIPVRLSARKDHFLLYLKEGEQVARFLSLVGAHQALLHYEDVRAFKEMKNRVNRQVNADTANLNKTIAASARQVETIRQIERQGGLQKLPPPLRELAKLRLSYPEASLKELGELLNPRVGKSGVSHRMRQLLQWEG